MDSRKVFHIFAFFGVVTIFAYSSWRPIIISDLTFIKIYVETLPINQTVRRELPPKITTRLRRFLMTNELTGMGRESSKIEMPSQYLPLQGRTQKFRAPQKSKNPGPLHPPLSLRFYTYFFTSKCSFLIYSLLNELSISKQGKC